MNDTLPGLGHNRPPVAWRSAEAKAIAAAQIAKAKAWADIKAITADQAGDLVDMIGALAAALKETETRRKADKAPHAEAAKAVDDAYRPITNALTRVKSPLDMVLAQHVKAQREEAARQAAEAKRQAAEAERQARQEAEAARAAGDTIAAEAAAAEAEAVAAAATKKAAAATKSAGQVKSASGLGRTLATRTRRVATLTDINQAFIAMRTHPRVAEVLTQLANEQVRARTYDGKPIPGFTITTEETLA